MSLPFGHFGSRFRTRECTSTPGLSTSLTVEVKGCSNTSLLSLPKTQSVRTRTLSETVMTHSHRWIRETLTHFVSTILEWDNTL